MKSISHLSLLGIMALMLASCNKPEPQTAAPPPPPPGADGKFSDPAAADFLKEYKQSSEKAMELLKKGESSRFRILMAEGTTFKAKTKMFAGRLKPEELPQFEAKAAEYEKAYDEVKALLPDPAKKIQEARAAAAAHLAELKAAAEAARNAPPPPAPPADATAAPAATTPNPVPAPDPAAPAPPAAAPAVPAPAATPAPPPAAPEPPAVPNTNPQ